MAVFQCKFELLINIKIMRRIIENLNCVLIVLIYSILLLSIPMVLMVELIINSVYKVAIFLKLKNRKNHTKKTQFQILYYTS